MAPMDIGLAISGSSAARSGDIGGLTLVGGGKSAGLLATAGGSGQGFSIGTWLAIGGMLALAIWLWRRNQ